MFAKPFLVAVHKHSWSWHFNALPFPGLAYLVHVTTGALFVKVVALRELRKIGFTTLVGLGEFIPNLKDTKDIPNFGAINTVDFLVKEGSTLSVPDGYIPLVSGAPVGEDSSTVPVALVAQVPDVPRARKIDSSDFSLIKTFLESGIEQNKGYKTWVQAAPLLLRWIDLVKP